MSKERIEDLEFRLRHVEFQLKNAREAIQFQRRELEELRGWATAHWGQHSPIVKKIDAMLYVSVPFPSGEPPRRYRGSDENVR